MGIAKTKQNFQDWVTQQWVILSGRKIDALENEWLMGPFGNTSGIGQKFIHQLAEKEQLIKDITEKPRGLLQSIHHLNLSEKELNNLSENVIDFYENTANYDLDLKVKWNPFFKGFGVALKVLFSNRIDQLNVPLKNSKDSNSLNSEIIHLLDSKTSEVKRTIWLRTFVATDQVVYSGIYDTCKIPSGQTCIRAVFPLPNGNATVILTPFVGENGELILTSSGKRIGDSGFYFLLNDSKGQLWTKFIRSFKDQLVVSSKDEKISAIQTLSLWGLRMLRFDYNIKKLSSAPIK